MGLLDFFTRKTAQTNAKAVSASPEVLQALQERQADFTRLIAVGPPPFGGSHRRIDRAVVESQSATYGWLYRTVPAVRSVIDFQARNIAQLALRLYERASDTERHEASDHPAAALMRRPNPTTPGQQFIFDFVAAWLVYNNAYLLKFRPPPDFNDLVLIQIPSHMVGIIGSNRYTIDAYRIHRDDGTWFDVSREDMIHWRGFDPEDSRKGISPLETLRKVLVEEAASQQANLELMKSGLMQPGWIARPLDAPEWSKDAQNRFQEEWTNQARTSDRRTPVLEEGMEFKDFGITPKDAEMLAGRRFTIEEVCRIYGVPSRLLSVEGSTATDDDHRRFYADVLPPICEMSCDYLDMGLLEEEFGATENYFEFDLDEKLMGDDRLKALVSAAGAPVMTRNEARAMINKPPKEGGDELVTPLNVIVGGKPSTDVMPVQDPNKPSQEGDHREQSLNGQGKAELGPGFERIGEGVPPQPDRSFVTRREAQIRRRDRYAKEFTELLQTVYASQEQKALRRTKEGKEFDPGFWDKALANDLNRLLESVVEREGGLAAARLGLDEFDQERVHNYLTVVAEEAAKALNRTTRQHLADGEVEEVYRKAKEVRAPEAGLTFATNMAAFAQIEAAKQTPDRKRRVKTWVVSDPEKSRHPELDNVTVPLHAPFPNGKQMPWEPGCGCCVEVT